MVAVDTALVQLYHTYATTSQKRANQRQAEIPESQGIPSGP